MFIQSDKLTVKDPQFKAAVQDVTSHLRKVAYVQNVKSPLDGESAVSENGHAALVDFDVAGDSTEAQDRIDPVLAAVAAAQKRHPDLASSRSATPAPTRRSTRRSKTTSQARACCRSRSP